MKTKVGELFGKPIVQGGGSNIVTKNEIELKEDNNKYILSERDSEGDITPITGGDSAFSLEKLEWYKSDGRDADNAVNIIVAVSKIIVDSITGVTSSYLINDHNLIFFGIKIPDTIIVESQEFSYSNIDELLDFLFQWYDYTDITTRKQYIKQSKVPYSEVKPYIK